MDIDISSLGIAPFAAIVVLCLLVGMACKASKLPNNWIPVVVGAVGAVLGVAATFLVPDFPATDYINAAAIGAISGLASTGLHQAYVQIKKTDQSE